MMWLKLKSFFINLYYWSGRLRLISEAQDRKKEYLALDLPALMGRFRWAKDETDWYPWIMTLAEREETDDCDGAAILARWWWKNHGVSSRLVALYPVDKMLGHMVCVRDDNTGFVSNAEVITNLDPANWQKNLLSRFDGQFVDVTVK